MVVDKALVYQVSTSMVNGKPKRMLAAARHPWVEKPCSQTFF
jgi:hypothetical protein